MVRDKVFTVRIAAAFFPGSVIVHSYDCLTSCSKHFCLDAVDALLICDTADGAIKAVIGVCPGITAKQKVQGNGIYGRFADIGNSRSSLEGPRGLNHQNAAGSENCTWWNGLELFVPRNSTKVWAGSINTMLACSGSW